MNTNADTAAISQSAFEEKEDGYCVAMWVSYSGKKKRKTSPTALLSHTGTHVPTIKIHHCHTSVWLCHHLICFTHTQMGISTKKTQLHKQNQVNMCKQGSQSLFALGRG